jgi:hypothetical protein
MVHVGCNNGGSDLAATGRNQLVHVLVTADALLPLPDSLLP